jgi:hypothetical protein
MNTREMIAKAGPLILPILPGSLPGPVKPGPLQKHTGPDFTDLLFLLCVMEGYKISYFL